jgi:HK97 family phage major capsid protein
MSTTEQETGETVNPTRIEQVKTGLEIAKLREALVGEIQKGQDAHQKQVDNLQAQLDEAHEKLGALASSSRSAASAIGIGAHAEDVRKLSLTKMIRGHLYGWDNESQLERDMVHETTTKAQEAGLDTAGGFLVPAEFMQDMLIPLLEPQSIAIRLGANVLDGLVGSPVEIPALRADATAYWVAEDEEITTSEMTFGQIEMEPRGLATLVPITNRLLRQTSNRVEGLVREQLSRTIGKAVDKAAYVGTGGKQPTGMLNRPGIGSVSWSSVNFGAAPTVAIAKDTTEALLEHIGDLEENDALMGRPAWSMHPKVKRGLMGITDTDGRSLLLSHSSGLSNQAPDQLLGYNFATSTQLSAGSDADIVFANMADLYIGFFENLQIAVSDVAKDAFEKRLTYVRATAEVDINLGNGESVSASTGCDVTTF